MTPIDLDPLDDLYPSEALLIYDASYKLIWTHPQIDTICTFNGGDEEPYAADDVQRITLSTARGSPVMTVIAKSPVLERYWEELFLLNEDPMDQDLPWIPFEPAKTQAMVDHLLMEFQVMFLEDVWAPGGKQFCFTPIGRKIGTLVRKVRNVQFSPDCVLRKDEDGYGFDT